MFMVSLCVALGPRLRDAASSSDGGGSEFLGSSPSLVELPRIELYSSSSDGDGVYYIISMHLSYELCLALRLPAGSLIAPQYRGHEDVIIVRRDWSALLDSVCTLRDTAQSVRPVLALADEEMFHAHPATRELVWGAFGGVAARECSIEYASEALKISLPLSFLRCVAL